MYLIFKLFSKLLRSKLSHEVKDKEYFTSGIIRKPLSLHNEKCLYLSIQTFSSIVRRCNCFENACILNQADAPIQNAITFTGCVEGV